MNTHSFRDGSSDPDDALDDFFRVRPMAPDDFARRTIAATQAKARRARAIRYGAWTSGLAASFALLLGLAQWQGGHPDERLASAPETAAETAVRARPSTPADHSAANELTLALHEAVSRQEVIFYGQALALEALLADTRALTEEEGRETLDLLILLAGS